MALSVSHYYKILPIFFITFVLLAICERMFPRRKSILPRFKRWIPNVSLAFFNVLILRLVLGGTAVGAAEYASERGWGFLNDVELIWPLESFIGFICLDFMVCLQHILLHAVPFLWRFHLVHHSDLDFDVTTGLRFHPVEILITMFFKIGLVVAIGIDPFIVAAYEILFSVAILFNHSNVKIPTIADSRLRKIIVTPDFHRIHHSLEPEEANSNFGFIFSWWDYIFGTFRARPDMPYNLMQLGTNEYRDSRELSLFSLILLPLLPKIGNYSFKKGG